MFCAPAIAIWLAGGRGWGPGKVYELNLNNLITSNVFLKGHRIRVQVSGSFYPNFSRNLQTGKSEVDSAEVKKARIRIYNDAQHPSQILLPVVNSTKAD